MSSMAITIRDIAREAGVSIATVSKVVNGNDSDIGSETKQRVLSIVHKYGYNPNSAARSLRTKRSHTIGFVLPDYDSPVYPPLLKGVDQGLRERGYTLLCYSSNNAEVDTLAVAVGTSHGVYKGEPKLNFDLLQELHEKVPVPLVIHGGSGTGDDNLRKLCKLGANKLNIAHDLYDGAINAVKNADLTGFKTYGFFNVVQQGYKEAALKAIDLCGSAHKA